MRTSYGRRTVYDLSSEHFVNGEESTITNSLQAGHRPDHKEPLTRGRILQCALALIDRHGLEALSMRRLASELDVAPMSLYNHLPNKEAVLEGICETMLAEIDLTPLELEDWAEALKIGFRDFRRVLLAHPNAVTLIETKPVVSPEYFRPVEASLELFRRAGFSPKEALHGHLLIVSLTLGHVMSQITNPMCNPDPETAASMRKSSLPPDEFPNLMRQLPYMLDYDFDESFEFALGTVMEGLEAKLPPR